MSDIAGAVPLAFTQQKAARSIDPEELEMMGKRAAVRHRDEGMGLTDAVIETVKEARLAPEQVKRVCEFANTTAYLHAFEKGGEVRNVTFEGGPADPGRALRDLNDGSNPAVHQVESNDYGTPSGSYKTAGVSMDKLAEAFGVQPGMEKSAEARTNHSLHANPRDDVYELKVVLEGVRQDLLSKLGSSGVIYDDVRTDLCHAVTQEFLQGVPLGDIARAFSGFTDNVLLHKQAMLEIGKHLTDRGVKQDALGSSLKKTASAGVVVNPQHPLLEKFNAFIKVAGGHRQLETAIKVVDEQLAGVRTKLRSML
jgi:hypothetical protein